MDEKDIEQRLGILPGETMKALVALAERISPKSPGWAFDSLWFAMPWLEQGQSGGQGTPHNVHPFASTGGNLNHFGFLMDNDLPTDERPIVRVVPKGGDEETEIIAPNLREFLGLIAIAFGEVGSRSASDEEWFGFRDAWYGEQEADDPERLAEMAHLSDALCTIPGVKRPQSPSKVARSCANQRFTINFDEAPGERTFFPRVEPMSRVLLKGIALGGLAAAILSVWKDVPLHWGAAVVPIAAASLLIPHLRGYDALTIGTDAITCRRRNRQWQLRYAEISRLYKFQEQWILETPPPHRRFTFQLRGHDHQLLQIAEVLDERARTRNLGWAEGLSKIMQLLR